MSVHARTVRGFVLVAMLSAGAAAQATVHTLTANLDGAQEVPAVVTPATGFSTLMIDDTTGGWVLTGSFINLIGTASNAHIHGFAPPGVSAGVVRGLTFTPATSGNVSGSSSLGLSGGTGALTPTEIAGILAGNSYLNIHSTFRTGGEIRGQYIVPTPGAAGLLALSSLCIARRRRR